MKKFRILSVIISSFLFTAFMSVGVSGNSQKAFIAENNTVKAARLCETHRNTLSYKEKIEVDTPMASIETGQPESVQTNLDTYVDENKNTYYYISGTDILCGFQKEYYYGFRTENPITETEAKRFAETYLKTIIPEFDEYTYIFSEYAQCDAVYHIQYSYCIEGIATDDLINIFVQENGEIGAFMMLRRSAYKNVILSNESKQLLQSSASQNCVSRYISSSNDGLVLLESYEEIHADGYSYIRQQATLLP